MKDYKSLEDFVSAQEDLLKIEHQAEIEQCSELYSKKSAKELEKCGLCIRNLSVRRQMTGMYGRFMVVFSPMKNKADEKAHRFKPGDIVGVYANKGEQSEPMATGTVTSLKDDVTVAFEEEFDTRQSSVFRLMKLTNDVTYKRLMRALILLSKQPINSPCLGLIDSLFPCKSATYDSNDCLQKEMRFFNENLNSLQKDAVKFVLHTINKVSVIHGPPGTGKTTTVLEVIRQSVKTFKNKVLVCAPSNIAVDNLVEKLFSANIKVVRLGHPARALKEVQRYTLDSLLMQHDSSDIIKSVRTDISTALSRLPKCKSKDERYSIYKEKIELRAELHTREKKAIKEVLSHADVVLSTLTSSSGDGPLKHLDNDHFDLLIVDEAGQALETSCWIPLVRSKKCILAGDHKQLPPTIISEKAAKGLSLTLLERVALGLGSNAVYMLTTQYRMNRLIMEWPSRMLYENRLTAAACVTDHLLAGLEGVETCPDTTSPLVFVDTAGHNMNEDENEEEESRCNTHECVIVRRHIQAILNAGVLPQHIGVITPYNLQVDVLRQNIHPLSSKIEISSVDGFQGREKEAILISLVRSNEKGGVGFLTEDRRINVAMTRARRQLFVVCDSRTVGRHPFLKSFCDYLAKHADVRSPVSGDGSSCDADVVVADTSRFELPAVGVVAKYAKNVKNNKHKEESFVAKSQEKSDCVSMKSPADSHLKRIEVKTKDTSLEATDAKIVDNLNEDQLRSVIENFAIGMDQEFAFPSSLTSKERAFVHELAEQHNLSHASEGGGGKRRIVLRKLHAQEAVVIDKNAPTKCEVCQTFVPKRNFDLHELRCARIQLQTKPKTPTNVESFTRKKKKKKAKNADEAVDDDFAILESFAQENSQCRYATCKQNVRTMREQCAHCNQSFCFSHRLAEVHGCARQASVQTKQNRSAPKPDYVSKIKKAQLANSLNKKITQMEGDRKKNNDKTK